MTYRVGIRADENVSGLSAGQQYFSNAKENINLRANSIMISDIAISFTDIIDFAYAYRRVIFRHENSKFPKHVRLYGSDKDMFEIALALQKARVPTKK